MAAASRIRPTATATSISGSVKAEARRPSGFVGVNSIFGHKRGHGATARGAAGNPSQADRYLAQGIGIGLVDRGRRDGDRARIDRAPRRSIRAGKPSGEVGGEVTATADSRPVIDPERFQLFQQNLVGAQVFLR